MNDLKQREIWVDNVKIFACILVVLGHFFQSMQTASILKGAVLDFFDQTIYYFHVPLFFICSGYLYQKLSKVNTFQSWWKNVLNKLIAFGFPYFFFSIVTWLIKNLFSSSVNTAVGGGVIESLFLQPLSPYWYLYILFFLFLITPTFNNKIMAYVGLGVALLLKIVSLIFNTFSISLPYFLSRTLENEIWFVIGMFFSVIGFNEYIRNHRKKYLFIGFVSAIIFLVFSGLIYGFSVKIKGLGFILGLIACFSTISLFVSLLIDKEHSKISGFLSQYTMPIFLMHTIFAAGIRILLLKLGIDNAVIHIICGIAISFIGPIIAAIVMKKLKWAEFFLYPNKFIKIK